MSGQVVLVAGGAGAVGHASIQLARWAGATVIAPVSNSVKAELAHLAGADHVVNYRDENAVTAIRAIAPDGVNVIVEVNLAANWILDQEVAAPGATIAIYAATTGDEVALVLRNQMLRNTRFQFVLVYTVSPNAKDEAVTAVNAAVADGALTVGASTGLPVIRFPLERTADAHDAVESGAVGKVLIDVSRP